MSPAAALSSLPPSTPSASIRRAAWALILAPLPEASPMSCWPAKQKASSPSMSATAASREAPRRSAGRRPGGDRRAAPRPGAHYRAGHGHRCRCELHQPDEFGHTLLKISSRRPSRPPWQECCSWPNRRASCQARGCDGDAAGCFCQAPKHVRVPQELRTPYRSRVAKSSTTYTLDGGPLHGLSAFRRSNGRGNAMKYFTAKDAKNQFGRLLDQSRVEPVLVVKHGQQGRSGRAGRISRHFRDRGPYRHAARFTGLS
jgi:hypothetical protein